MLYCETVFAITEYPPNQLIVKRPESGIGRPAPCPPSRALSRMVGALTLCPPCGPETKLDCFVASAFARRRASADRSVPRNDVVTFRIQISNSRCASAFSRRHVARVLQERCPSKRRGSRECRMRAAPAVSCAKCAKESAHEHTGSAEAIRHSLRNGFTAYFALSPENRALLSPSPPGNWHVSPVGLSHLRKT